MQSGLAALTRTFVGWGTQFLDYDNDGNLDLALVNGHLNDVLERTRQDVSYLELPLLLQNTGDGHFRNVAALGAHHFRKSTEAVAWRGDWAPTARLSQSPSRFAGLTVNCRRRQALRRTGITEPRHQ